MVQRIRLNVVFMFIPDKDNKVSSYLVGTTFCQHHQAVYNGKSLQIRHPVRIAWTHLGLMNMPTGAEFPGGALNQRKRQLTNLNTSTSEVRTQNTKLAESCFFVLVWWVLLFITSKIWQKWMFPASWHLKHKEPVRASRYIGSSGVMNVVQTES